MEEAHNGSGVGSLRSFEPAAVCLRAEATRSISSTIQAPATSGVKYCVTKRTCTGRCVSEEAVRPHTR